MDIFHRYAPFVQDYIYRNKWEDLRAIQVAAAHGIFNTDDHVLLSAATASGKTEAAFFPIITLFTEKPPTSVGCIYVGPLKALINDQFARLNELCEEAAIPVWHWHGDVSQTHKNRLLKRPSGILQITPESLEAILLHKHGAVAQLFHDLRFVVIDEVHSLLRGDRGGQTLCLIERLSRIAGVNPRRIGLSATIGDLERTGKFLASGTNRKTFIPKIEAKKTKWHLSMEHFFIKDDEKEDDEEEKLFSEFRKFSKKPWHPDSDDDKADKHLGSDPSLSYIYDQTNGKKCLVFVNSREECEAVTASLHQYCENAHVSDRFLIHHGNLSPSLRQTAEEAMKDDSRLLTTVTTSTLELGIDIGRLERAIQLDAPWTVSSFLQRMGRTGRRDLPPEMFFVMREDEPEPRAMLPDTIPWKLLQGIAIVQLYMEERWVEPPALDRYPFSLLYHQTMATLASEGELSPPALASRILGLSFFHKVSQDDYRILLRHLLETEHIERTEQGGLIVGVNGERVINSYRFYGVFKENEEFTVRSDSQELGTIVSPPPVGEKIAIAGHVWTVLEVDYRRHLVYCEQVKGKIPAYFGVCAGDVHTRILQRMQKVLAEDTVYPYLRGNAVRRLAAARNAARMAGVHQKPLINLGGNLWAFFPWLGTYPFITLERVLRLKCASRIGLQNFESARPYYLQFAMSANEDEFFGVLKEELAKSINPLELVYPGEIPQFNKYDEYLPKELVVKGFARGVLDLKTLRETSASWPGKTGIK